MDAGEVRRKAVEFVRSYHEAYGVQPTIRLIFEKTGLSRRQVYSAFPDGLAGVCRESGIPAPKDRVERTRKATAARVQEAGRRRGLKAGTVPRVETYSLTEGQINRFRGLLHLEPERRDVASVIDTWLDMDTELRREWGLKDVQEVALAVSFAEQVRKRGLKSGVYDFDFSKVEAVGRFIRHMRTLGWKPDEVPGYVTTLWNLGVGVSVDRGALDALNELRAQASKAGRKLGGYIAGLAEDSRRLRAELEALEGQRSRLNVDKDRLSREVEGLQRQRSVEAQRFVEAKSTVDRAIAEYQRTQVQRFSAEWTRKLEKARAEVEAAEKQRDRLSEDARTRAEAAEKERNRVAEEAAALRQECEVLQARAGPRGTVTNLVKQLDAVKGELVDTKRELVEKAGWLSGGFNARLEAERWLMEERKRLMREVEAERSITKHLVEEAGSLPHLFLFLANRDFPEEHFKRLKSLVLDFEFWRSHEPPAALKELLPKGPEVVNLIKADLDRYFKGP
jgi:hypothetical protein